MPARRRTGGPLTTRPNDRGPIAPTGRCPGPLGARDSRVRPTPVAVAEEWGGDMEDVVLADAEDVGIELVEESAETEQYVYVWVRIRLI